MKRSAFYGFLATGLLIHSFALAQGPSTTIDSLIIQISGYIEDAFLLLVGVAVLMVVWGIVKFIINADDETARANGRQVMLWGIVGIFVMMSIWGFVHILTNSFFVPQELNAPTFPKIVPQNQ